MAAPFVMHRLIDVMNMCNSIIYEARMEKLNNNNNNNNLEGGIATTTMTEINKTF